MRLGYQFLGWVNELQKNLFDWRISCSPSLVFDINRSLFCCCLLVLIAFSFCFYSQILFVDFFFFHNLHCLSVACHSCNLWQFDDVFYFSQVMMNAMNVPSKRSTLERKLDKLILTLFGTLFVMCLIGAIGRFDDC